MSKRFNSKQKKQVIKKVQELKKGKSYVITVSNNMSDADFEYLQNLIKRYAQMIEFKYILVREESIKVEEES